MAVVSIATSDTSQYVESLRARLARGSRFLENEGLSFDITESSKGRFKFLGCNVEKKPQCGLSPQDAVILFKHFVANTISDFIVDDVEESLIRKIIRQNYCYFTPEEQERIFAAVEKELDGDVEDRTPLVKSAIDAELGIAETTETTETFRTAKTAKTEGTVLKPADRHVGEVRPKAIGKRTEADKTRRLTRKAKILNKVLDYLTANEVLVVEGFVTFRLREYLDELEEVVDRAVDEFLLDREYQEFIKLLRYFVQMQEPKVMRVKVYLERDGTFSINDELGKRVGTAVVDELRATMMEGGLELEDLLVSSLIMLAPREIWMHSRDNERWSSGLETLKNVFGERLKICCGCPWCSGSGGDRDGGGDSQS
ncbi:MAG TPA: hypothetical protein GX507_03795 [Clostridia bacterium]|nr:hypothetical protein [Clostridia bacterium]